MEILLDENIGYYKANMHCHTTCSDGKLSPLEIKEAYKARGYSIVAFTDHEHVIDHSDLTDESFLALTGCEVAIKEFPTQSTMKNFAMRVCHLNFIAINPTDPITPCYNTVADHFITDEARGKFTPDGEYERRYTHKGISDMIERAHTMGYLVAYNHPTWSLENFDDYAGYKDIDFVEIYNTGCVKAGYADDERVFEELLLLGRRVLCTAGDDNHNRTPLDSPSSDSFGGFVMINEKKLDYPSIIKALWQGRTYVSDGVLIEHLTLDGYTVRIKVSGAKEIHLRTGGRRCDSRFADTEPLREATFELRPDDKFFRLKIIGTDGTRAFTQAYYL